MWRKHLTLWIGLLLSVALLSAPSGAAASPRVLLYTQTDMAGGLSVSSTDFAGTLNVQDNQVADDFRLSCTGSCRVDSVFVLGGYQSGGASPTSVRVQFYSDAEYGIPGYLHAERLVPPGDVGDLTGGDFLITLNPGVVLGGGTWWLSVQAVMPTGFRTWTWDERIAAAPSVWDSAWQNPGGAYGVCRTWGPRLDVCNYPTGTGHDPDQLFEMNGENTGNNVAPYITRLVPFHVLPGSPDFTLTLRGHSYVPGSQVRWNGVPVTVTTTYNGHSELQVSVPASMVTTAQIVAITVFNPGPGGGLSNTRHFLVGIPTFLPVMRR